MVEKQVTAAAEETTFYRPQRVIEGYTIQTELGRGAFGEVYRGYSADG